MKGFLKRIRDGFTLKRLGLVLRPRARTGTLRRVTPASGLQKGRGFTGLEVKIVCSSFSYSQEAAWHLRRVVRDALKEWGVADVEIPEPWIGFMEGTMQLELQIRPGKNAVYDPEILGATARELVALSREFLRQNYPKFYLEAHLERTAL